MLTATGLTKRFGSLVAVQDVSLAVPVGCVTGMLGPNGAGKTTTLRMLCGVLEPDSGTIALNGVDLRADPRRAKAHLGWLPDSAPAWAELRVEDWLKLRTRLFGSGIDRIDLVLEQCDLVDVRRRIIGRLSRGYRQRVALAAAIVHDPALLILDEPGTGLDPVQQRAFRTLIRTLAKDRAVLLSTHQLSDAQAICDNLILIADGRIVAEGTVQDLRRTASAGRLTLETQCDPVAVLADVDGIANTVCAQLSDGWFRANITPSDGSADLRLVVANAIGKAGLQWRELSLDGGALESLIEAHLEGAPA